MLRKFPCVFTSSYKASRAWQEPSAFPVPAGGCLVNMPWNCPGCPSTKEPTAQPCRRRKGDLHSLSHRLFTFPNSSLSLGCLLPFLTDTLSGDACLGSPGKTKVKTFKMSPLGQFCIENAGAVGGPSPGPGWNVRAKLLQLAQKAPWGPLFTELGEFSRCSLAVPLQSSP